MESFGGDMSAAAMYRNMFNRDKTSVNTKKCFGKYGQEPVIYQYAQYAKRAVNSCVMYRTFPTAVLACHRLAPKHNRHMPQTTLSDKPDYAMYDAAMLKQDKMACSQCLLLCLL